MLFWLDTRVWFGFRERERNKNNTITRYKKSTMEYTRSEKVHLVSERDGQRSWKEKKYTLQCKGVIGIKTHGCFFCRVRSTSPTFVLLFFFVFCFFFARQIPGACRPATDAKVSHTWIYAEKRPRCAYPYLVSPKRAMYRGTAGPGKSWFGCMIILLVILVGKVLLEGR